MRSFQKRKGLSRFFQSVPALVLLSLGLAFFAYSMIGLWSRMRETVKNKELAQAKVAELQKNKENLNQNIGKLNTDEGVEESIREKFGVVKEGEGVIVIVEDQNPPPSEGASTGGFFSFFTRWFK